MSELKIGYCKYCGDPVNVEANPGEPQGELNHMAAQQCDCYDAKDAREKAAKKETCIYNIDQMLSEKYPEIAELFKNSIDAIQETKIKKITVNTHFNQTARLFNTKDGIKVELEKKQKVESLA